MNLCSKVFNKSGYKGNTNEDTALPVDGYEHKDTDFSSSIDINKVKGILKPSCPLLDIRIQNATSHHTFHKRTDFQTYQENARLIVERITKERLFH